MKLKTIAFSLLAGFSITVAYSCEKDDKDECNNENLTYSNYAKNIIEDNCAESGCHDGQSSTFAMTDYATTKEAVDFGRILGAINHEDGFSNMPKGEDKMVQCDIDKLTAWINAGAPE